MYEHMRNAFATEIAKILNRDDVDIVLAKLDKVAADYDISEKSTEIMVLDDIFPQIAKTYIAVKNLEGCSHNTIELYGRQLKNFFEWVGKLPEDITTNDIRLFLAGYKTQRGVSDRTLDKYRQIIRGFFTWATDEEYIMKNPCRNIKEIKYEITPRRALTRFQFEKLRRACRTKRDIAIVDVLYSTGCRVSELTNMRLSDVDFVEKTVKIVGKGNKHNTVYLNTNAQLSLEDYLKSRDDDSDYLFVSERKPHDRINSRTVEHVFNLLSQDVNFRVTPHIIRHTTATLGLQSGMKITEVQKMLGHSSVNTTQIYAETSQEDVRAAHLKYVI